MVTVNFRAWKIVIFLLRMTSAKLKYTNLETYFGLEYRENRVGNSSGLRRSKIANYVDKLFIERQKTGMDSFSEENLKQTTVTNIFWEKIISFFLVYLCLVRLSINRIKNFIRMVAYCFLLLISPHKAYELFKIIQRRLIIMKHQHKSTRNRIS